MSEHSSMIAQMKFKNKTIYSIAGILFFSLFLLILFSNKGYFDLNTLKKERDKAIKENTLLKKENKDLYRIIKRLKTDNEYIEVIARKELGMIGKDEIIIKFNNKTPKEKK